jgi:membrane protease subunit HflC
MHQTKTLGLIILLIVLVILYSSVYSVRESQQAIILRLGNIVKNSDGQAKVAGPGLHFKLPFIHVIRKFDTRLQTMDVQSSRILTQEQKYVLVDYYAKWKISDLPRYYTSTGGYPLRAQTLLEQKINNVLRAEFGKRTIKEVISRGSLMETLKNVANESASGLGIKVLDVRIKRIDLPNEVSKSVFARMRTKREQVANKHRSDGQAAAEKIRAQADADVTVIIATAKEKAANIRAKGDALAATVYADAYGKDAAFFAFYRSLEAYKEIFNNKQDILVIKPDSQFFKYFGSFDNAVN